MNVGLKRLAKLKNLTDLIVGHTSVTDDGLAALSEFPSLTSINLYGTQITETAANELKKLLPQTDISR